MTAAAWPGLGHLRAHEARDLGVGPPGEGGCAVPCRRGRLARPRRKDPLPETRTRRTWPVHPSCLGRVLLAPTSNARLGTLFCERAILRQIERSQL